MSYIVNPSPYWCADPRIPDRAADAIRRILHDPQDTADAKRTVHAMPCSPLPVASPDAYGQERRRLLSCMLLPFPWLPADMWMRRPGEPLAAWQTRLLIGMDVLGLIGADGNGDAEYKPVDGIPDDSDTVSTTIAAFDGDGESPLFDAIRDRMLDRAKQAWPDGYPLAMLMDTSRTLAALSMIASPVLAAHNAVQYAADGHADEAVELLKATRDAYGPLFDPESMTPDGVRAWRDANLGRVDRLADMLTGTGLETRENMDTVMEALR